MKVTFQLDSKDRDAFLRVTNRWNGGTILLLMPMTLIMQIFIASNDQMLPLKFARLGWQSLIFPAVILIGTLVILAVMYAFSKRAWEAQLQKSLFFGSINVVVGDESVALAASDKSEIIPWSAVHRIIETATHFFVLRTPDVGVIIPKRAFDSPAQAAEFGEFLNQKRALHKK